ncbi:MAG: hypothetical protein KDK44_03480 [Chlamydiia bacterium]|nr:hypothetical protein [Chlamydiia bacterium]
MITYGLSDPEILKLLDSKKNQGLDVFALCDQRSTPKHPGITRIKKPGLNHAKIAVVDDHLSLFGSANLTTTSLELHHNCVMGIESESVATFFKSSITNQTNGALSWQNLQLWMLPDKTAFFALLDLIDQAEKSIKVAMFTLSHPELIEALEKAQQRGVTVNLYLDRYTRQPHTKLSINHTKGPGLLHHKWALVDDRHLAMGSANWTKAAFTKNREVLVIIRNLPPAQVRVCQKLWNDLS